MTSSTWALQTAVKAALEADSGLLAIFGAAPFVYDRVPEERALPYIGFADWSVNAQDTDDTRIDAHSFTVQAWSNYAGLKEAKAAAIAVEQVLHGAALTLDGQSLIDLAYVGSAFTQDERQGLSRADIRFRALTQAV